MEGLGQTVYVISKIMIFLLKLIMCAWSGIIADASKFEFYAGTLDFFVLQHLIWLMLLVKPGRYCVMILIWF